MKTQLVILVLFNLILFGCVSPFEYKVKNDDKKLVIEGRIYDIDSCFVKLSYTITGQTSAALEPLPDADVKVIESGITEIPFTYDASIGVYLPEDKSFRGSPGNTYQLKAILANGESYESTADTLKVAVQPEQINSQFRPEESTYDVLINLGRKGLNRDYYIFNFINYKRATFCASCPFSMGYRVRKSPEGISFFESCDASLPGIASREGSYSFYCINETTCWNYQRIRESKIFSTEVLATGTEILVDLFQVPFSSREAYFLETHQSSVSREAYNYFKLLNEFSKSGTLFDPTPPRIVGNLYNERDENDIPLGYFLVAGQQVYGYWIKRDSNEAVSLLTEDLEKEYFDTGVTILGSDFYGGPSIPLAPCIANEVRTNKMPEDWDSYK